MTFADVWGTLWPFIAGTAGGVGGVAVAAFTKAGDRVSEYLVGKQIASFRHGLEAQIERLRADLAHLSDRGARSNELEYAAIISAWEHFVDAYIATQNCVVRAFSHPDFKRLSDADAEKYLKSTKLSEAQREQVLADSDRNRAYVKIFELRLIAEAGTAIYGARSVLRKQGIFIPEELELEFERALQMCSDVQVQRHMEFDYGPLRDAPDKTGPFFKDGQKLFDGIKSKVRERILVGLANIKPKA